MTNSGFIELEIYNLTFYSSRDEENLFSWLGSVAAIKEIRGAGDSIFVKVAASIEDDDLSEIISIFTRYGVSMKQLAAFDDGRFPWLKRKGMFWYEPIFG